MTIKVGINGFGRIGRMVFRAAVQNFSDIEIVGINDLLEPDYLAYMLQFDSVHGRFKGQVSVQGSNLVVNGKTIRLTAIKDPAELKWNEIGADVVAKPTGFFLGQERPCRFDRPFPDQGNRCQAYRCRCQEGHSVRPVQGRHPDVCIRRQ